MVANLLKRYLRLLSPPLLTDDLYDAFLEATKDVDDESLTLSKLCACVMKLPPLNHDILAELLKMLKIVLECEDRNRMGIDNLATVFAPCLLHKQMAGGFTDPSHLTEELRTVCELLRSARTIVLLDRVGAAPRDTGESSSAFPGIRVLSNPNFSASPILARKNQSPSTSESGPVSPRKPQSMVAYAKYDYKGSMSADTLTVARGEAVSVVQAGERWCMCRLKHSPEEGYLPTAFLDCPALNLQRVPLARERALSRAGNASLPSSSPLRATSRNSIPSSIASPMASDPLAALRDVSAGSVRSVEELSDRMEILTRALVKEKEERVALEKKLEALLAQ